MNAKGKNQLLNIIKALLIPVFIIILWQIGSMQGWFKTNSISTPEKIGLKFLDLLQRGTLQQNILISIQRVLLGYLLGSVIGIVFGILCGVFGEINAYLRLIMSILRPIPLIVWVPMLILWVGIGETTKVIVIAIGTFWPVYLNVLDGVCNVDKKYLEVATIFIKSKKHIIFHVVIPAALPHLLSGLKIASGNALVGVISAEMFSASSGLGYMVNFAREMNQPQLMMCGVLIIAILGAMLNAFVQKLNQNRKWK